jgi:2-oxoglutarate dehydrogenase complex dehydrogenase (E1) component-like enzyme
VTMTWIGDGGTSTGVFHEGLNLAAVQKAPLVLIVENNQWAYSTPVERQTPLRDLADRAKAYGIESAIVDGNDVVAVERTARQAVAHARAGHGPVLIEAKTMRMRGHAQHDSAEYVPKEMLESWKQRDPLDLYEKFLNENKLWDAKTKKEIEARIARVIQADVEFAENSPFPPPELAGQGVYCEGCHTVEADWKRPKEEVMPPRSSVKAEWRVRALLGARQHEEVKRVARTEAPAKPAAKAATSRHGSPRRGVFSVNGGQAGNGSRSSATNKGAPKSKPGKKPARASSRAKMGRTKVGR